MPQSVFKDAVCTDTSSNTSGTESTKSSTQKLPDGSRRRSSSKRHPERGRLFAKARQIIEECDGFSSQDRVITKSVEQKDACTRQTSSRFSERMKAFIQEHERDANSDNGNPNTNCEKATEETRCDRAQGHVPMQGSSTTAGDGSDRHCASSSGNASSVRHRPKKDCISL